MMEFSAPVHYEVHASGPSCFYGEIHGFSIHKSTLSGRSYISIKGQEYVYMMMFENEDEFLDESRNLIDKFEESQNEECMYFSDSFESTRD